MDNEGKLIVIEGACDGIGKTTQYNLLCNHLKEDGLNVYNHHFPSYDTYQGEGVTRYLKGEFGNIENLSPYFINSLYAYDRAITWHSKLKNIYENNNIIVLDRYTTSSIIYQSALIEDPEEKIKFIDYVINFEYEKLQIKVPDNVIFLVAPFDIVQNMRNNRKDNDGVKNDIHESNIDFMKKVYNNALFVANYLNWDIINCYEDNKMKDINTIHNEIYNVIKRSKVK